MSWPSLQWPRRREVRLFSPRRQAASLKVLELQTAKEILAEIFRARPEDIEDMIQRRLEERNWREEHEWPVTFSLESDHGQELCEREAGPELGFGQAAESL